MKQSVMGNKNICKEELHTGTTGKVITTVHASSALVAAKRLKELVDKK